jgi:hypothetical protein
MARKTNLVDRKKILVLVMGLLFTGLLFAHGNQKHVMGTVKSVGADSIVVETTSHQVQTVQTTSQTKFIKDGDVSSLSDLKVGDRVVIHAKASGDKLEAAEVKFGAVRKAIAKKK